MIPAVVPSPVVVTAAPQLEVPAPRPHRNGRHVRATDAVMFTAPCPACGQDCDWTGQREGPTVTVYVDNAFISAHVGRTSSLWCHLFADTEPELHDFAGRLGLRRSWFQQPKGVGGQPVAPHSFKAQMWHYDVTMAVRARAVRLGAVEVTTREALRIMHERHARSFPEEAARLTHLSQPTGQPEPAGTAQETLL